MTGKPSRMPNLFWQMNVIKWLIKEGYFSLLNNTHFHACKDDDDDKENRQDRKHFYHKSFYFFEK